MSKVTLRELLPLLMVVAVIGSNSLSLGPIAPGIATDLAASVETVLYGSAGYGLGTGVAALLLARWIDYFGPLPVLRITCLMLALAFAGCVLATNVSVLVMMQIVAGLAAGVALPAVYAQAAIISPAGHESRVLGRVLLGWTISMVGGVTLAALLADFMGWRSVYFLLSLLSLFVLFRFQRLSAAINPNAAEQRPVAAPSPWAAWLIPGVPLLLLKVALYMVSFYAVYGFVGDYVVQSLKRPLSANAWVVVAYGSGFGMAAFLDAQLDRFNTVITTPIALLSLALVYVALYLSEGFVLLVSLAFFWGLMNHLALNVLIARLSAADPAQRGTVLGLYSGITYLCMGFATLLAGVLYARIGWPLLNVLAASLCIVAALLAFPQARRTWYRHSGSNKLKAHR